MWYTEGEKYPKRRNKIMSGFITFDNVCKYYTMGDHKITAADHVSFTIEKGEFVVIVGPSGAGKTTVLNMLGGMDTSTTLYGRAFAKS